MSTDLLESANLRYTSGISNEPKQVLQPITGYAYEPLLSLEEACEPLLNIVPRLQAHIWVAKQNSKNPSDDLTQDESAAIRLYTMEWDPIPNERSVSLYIHLNRTLKEVDRTKLRPWFRYLKLFVTALAKIPLSPRQIVWRGIKKNQSQEYEPGTEITWWAFSSCTTSLNVLESNLYLGKEGTRTLFSIDAISARSIRAHSHFTTEDEILLLPGTFFEVKSRLNPAADLYIVHLQQRIPPFALLEPPFKDAQLFPPVESSLYRDASSILDARDQKRPWYKRRRFMFGIMSIVLIIIFIILLTTLLATRNNSSSSSTSTTDTSTSYDSNLTVFPPVSVAYAFYSFDGNTVDLYHSHDGKINGGMDKYIDGYVGSGQAILLNQSSTIWISVSKPFILNRTDFTIETFIYLLNDSSNTSLVEFSSGIYLNIYMSYLVFSLAENATIYSEAPLSINQWHHVTAVASANYANMKIYVDGKLSGQFTNPVPINLNDENTTMIIGYRFQGMIDQLSISLEAKSSDRILWDATVVGYYPLDGSSNGWLLDYGPNSQNATSSDTTAVTGEVRSALSFNDSDSYYKIGRLTALDLSYKAFTVALWIQPTNQSGSFLTISNSVTCLLILGIRSSDNHLVAYLPNATNTTDGIIITGSPMISNAWVHVAFTWNTQNQAQLFKSSSLQDKKDVSQLNRGYGESMSVTLGNHHDKAVCTGGDGLNMTEQFIGSLDDSIYFQESYGKMKSKHLVQQRILNFGFVASCFIFLLYHIKYYLIIYIIIYIYNTYECNVNPYSDEISQ